MSRLKKAWADESENISPNESTRSSPGRFESMSGNFWINLSHTLFNDTSVCHSSKKKKKTNTQYQRIFEQWTLFILSTYISDERLRQEMAYKSNNSLASGSSQSNSPPDSPYGSQYLVEQGIVICFQFSGRMKRVWFCFTWTILCNVYELPKWITWKLVDTSWSVHTFSKTKKFEEALFYFYHDIGQYQRMYGIFW